MKHSPDLKILQMQIAKISSEFGKVNAISAGAKEESLGRRVAAAQPEPVAAAGAPAPAAAPEPTPVALITEADLAAPFDALIVLRGERGKTEGQKAAAKVLNDWMGGAEFQELNGSAEDHKGKEEWEDAKTNFGAIARTAILNKKALQALPTEDKDMVAAWQGVINYYMLQVKFCNQQSA